MYLAMLVNQQSALLQIKYWQLRTEIGNMAALYGYTHDMRKQDANEKSILIT